MLHSKNILLWRHADAEPLEETDGLDAARPLNKKGQKQAGKMANWLLSNLPKNSTIISSNALRAKQTANALGLEYLVFASLAPNASLEIVLDTLCSALNDSTSENLLVVGHQPWIGLLAAQLLNLPHALPENAKEISIKKGAVWWFKRPTTANNQPFKLFTVQAPSLL